ncbi:PrsW family intramembrane metalloprotease [Brachybacterium sp. GCM10030267]|uniref:PrsW family intramembrane metalloprotease n=1 Tax=Brachybacterium sp. GCM10030267 TaxID=3273381 RepID=UPI00361F9D6E
MSHPPQQPPSGQYMPNGRPRPGAGSAGGSPSGPSQPRYVDYGNPRAYDTSVRPASGLTAARYAPARIRQPDQEQPPSAWTTTQARRAQEVSQSANKVPVTTVVSWIVAAMLGILLIVILGLFFLGFVISSSSSPIWWPVTAFLALISLIVIIGIMILADRWDPQPIPLLIVAVLWGAAVGAGLSYLLNTANSILTFWVTGSEAAANFVGPVISAPLVEETTKGLGLLLLMLLGRRYFNGPLDGLIYGTLIGGGFAFTENILYYTRALEGAGEVGLLINVVMRGVLNIFGHAIYTSLTGITVGFVVRKWGTVMGLLAFIPALIPGMLLHALWNLGATLFSGIIALLVMYALEALISLAWLILIAILVWDESRLTRVRLGDYANHGWLTHEEVDMLGTWKGRREGKRWANQLGAKPLMKKFIRESADLASVRQRLLADGANPKVVALESDLLRRLTTNRQALLARAGHTGS